MNSKNSQKSEGTIHGNTANVTIDVRMIYASGIGTYLRNTLPKVFLSSQNYNFFLICQREDFDRLGWKFDNVSFIFSKSTIYSLAQQWEIPRLVPKNTHILWVPHYDIPLFYRGPLLVTVHDVAHLALTDLYKGMKRLYAKVMFAALRHKARFIICVSEFSRQEMIRLTGCGRQNSETVHLGIDEFWFEPPKNQVMPATPHLIFVGNIKPHKNLRGLLAAFGRIKDQIPHDLVIVGKRDGFITGDDAVQKAISEFGGRVRFTGYISDDELKAAIATADALILPSFYEGFGLPPLEAMACGCPTLVSNAGSLPEICADAALYCDPHDPADMAEAILRLVNDAPLRDDLRRRGMARARSLRWDACANRTLEILDDCLKPR